MKLFDTHAHYNDEKFNEDSDMVIQEAYSEGVTNIVNVGYNIESSKKSITMAEKYEYIYAACGIHPSDVPQSEEEIDELLKEVKKLAKHKKVVAIGEIGLDYYWYKENIEIQKKTFIKQIELANELNLPIIIHTRDSSLDTLDILKNIIMPNKKSVFHCCPLNQELVKEALKLGFYVSFAGSVTFKNSKNANEIIDMVPLESMLIETDSPYLSPEPNRGKRNDSRNLKYIVEKIANVKNISIEEISRITYENGINLFQIS